MFAVEPGRGLERDEELATVSVLATVGHREQTLGGGWWLGFEVRRSGLMGVPKS